MLPSSIPGAPLLPKPSSPEGQDSFQLLKGHQSIDAHTAELAETQSTLPVRVTTATCPDTTGTGPGEPLLGSRSLLGPPKVTPSSSPLTQRPSAHQTPMASGLQAPERAWRKNRSVLAARSAGVPCTGRRVTVRGCAHPHTAKAGRWAAQQTSPQHPPNQLSCLQICTFTPKMKVPDTGSPLQG